MKLEIHATPKEVMRAVEALQMFGRDLQLGEKEIFVLALVLEECGSNIVQHAYRRDSQQKFQVTIDYTPKSIIIELRDRGPEFDPTQVQVASQNEQQTAGWGIPLIRRHMDEIHYRREAGENVLRLTKRLARAGNDSAQSNQN